MIYTDGYEEIFDSCLIDGGTSLISIDTDKIYKALISVVIETAILDMGRPVYEKVVNRLYKQYNCYLPDCSTHPEYLCKVLKDILGYASFVIVKSINKDLATLRDKDSVARFLEVVDSGKL